MLTLALAACSGSGHHANPVSQRPVATTTSGTANTTANSTAKFGQPFALGKLTIVVTDGGTVPDPSPGAKPRRRLVIKTDNRSGVSDRAPGLAVVCEHAPQLSGGSLYSDPDPHPRPFLAGKPEPAGTTDAASITVALAPACSRPALQVSPGGATINGLPRPVIIPM